MTDKDEYRRLWSGQIAADPYLQWLGRADEKVQASEPFRLTIVDVLLSGDAEHYELASPSGDVLKNKFYLSDELQLWLRATKQQLSTFKSEIQTRIIIFSDDSDITVRNLLGTKYNIEPEFFADIQHERWMRKGHDWGSMMGTGKLRWQGAYQAFKYANGKAIRHLKFENGFIACLSHDVASDPKANKNVVSHRYKPTTVAQFCRSGLLPMSEMPWHKKGDPYINTNQLYLAGTLRTHADNRKAANIDPLLHLLPVLQIQCDMLAGELGYHHEILHGYTSENNTLTSDQEALEVSWRDLRSLLRSGPKPFHVFKSLDQRWNGKRGCRDKEYLRLQEHLGQLMSEAQSLEQLARDYLQMTVGILSLAESRASIKQSKIALEESKRTKLVTVLAFVFVPLSIGTSTFGMDLDELNGSGPRLWVFCLTTIVIFILSALVWAALSQVHKYYRLEESALVENSPERHFTGGWMPVPWHFRLRLFFRLILHGHLFWMWRSGIAFSLATSGRKAFLRSCTSCARFSGVDLNGRERLSDQASQQAVERFLRLFETHDAHKPCAYIMRHLEEGGGFECKKLVYSE